MKPKLEGKTIIMDYGVRIAAALFLAAFVLQGLHEVEHVAQVYQRLWLGVGPQSARGILFFLDVEWNHFLFNAGYFLLLAAISFFLFFHPALAPIRNRGKAAGLFAAGFLLQAYHVVEHTARMGQFFNTNCTPCPGILGWYIDIAYLHFIFNTLTWLLPLAVAPALLTVFRRFP